MSDHTEVEPLETDLQPVVPAVRDLLPIYARLANAVQGNEVHRAYEAALELVAQANIVADELEFRR